MFKVESAKKRKAYKSFPLCLPNCNIGSGDCYEDFYPICNPVCYPNCPFVNDTSSTSPDLVPQYAKSS